jgi:hypothetical protein
MRRGNVQLATIVRADMSENDTSKATEVTAWRLITLLDPAIALEHG